MVAKGRRVMIAAASNFFALKSNPVSAIVIIGGEGAVGSGLELDTVNPTLP